MTRAAKYRPEFCDKAVMILENGKSLAAVCAALDISRTTLYEWRDSNPDFSEAIERGLQKCQAYWEEMGHDGAAGDNENFCATPWIFTMKNRFRDDYAEDKADNKTVSDSIVEKLIDKLVD